MEFVALCKRLGSLSWFRSGHPCFSKSKGRWYTEFQYSKHLGIMSSLVSHSMHGIGGRLMATCGGFGDNYALQPIAYGGLSGCHGLWMQFRIYGKKVFDSMGVLQVHLSAKQGSNHDHSGIWTAGECPRKRPEMSGAPTTSIIRSLDMSAHYSAQLRSGEAQLNETTLGIEAK